MAAACMQATWRYNSQGVCALARHGCQAADVGTSHHPACTPLPWNPWWLQLPCTLLAHFRAPMHPAESTSMLSRHLSAQGDLLELRLVSGALNWA